MGCVLRCYDILSKMFSLQQQKQYERCKGTGKYDPCTVKHTKHQKGKQ